MVATALHERLIECTAAESSIFDPPVGQTCGEYLSTYLTQAAGSLANPEATSACQYCPLTNADQFMASSRIYWGERFRNFGLVWVYVVFNITGAVFLYWFFRVRPLHDKGKPGLAKKLKDWSLSGGASARRLFVRHADEDKKGREKLNPKVF